MNGIPLLGRKLRQIAQEEHPRLDQREVQRNNFIASLQQELQKARDDQKAMEREFRQRLHQSEEALKEHQLQFEKTEDTYRSRDKKQLSELDRYSQWYENKRALWMDTNTEPSARREQLLAIRNPTSADYPPFDSLSTTNISRPEISRLPDFNSPSSSNSFNNRYGAPPQMMLPTGPASQTPSRRRPFPHDLPTQRALPYSTRSIASSQGVMPPPRAEAGDDSSYYNVSSRSPEASVEEYKDDINRLFQMIEGWTRSYTRVPNYDGDKAIAATEQHTWQYMTQCVNPYRQQEAYTHIMALLADSETRCMFVKRMLVEYCTKNILHIKAWEHYSSQVKQAIQAVKDGLAQRGRPLPFELICNPS